MSTPLHPIIVHFPIALLFLAAICQIIALWKPAHFDKLATGLLGLGLLSGAAAYLTGDDGVRFAINTFGATRDMVHRHENMAFLTMVSFGVLFAIKLLLMLPSMEKRRANSRKWFIPLALVLSLAGGTFVFLTGHFGGQIVYHNNMSGQTYTPQQNVGDDKD
ncbi:DUF2231 domain-containing protein [Paenibacillus sediminis]|uniref:Membrane protein n=1 Tax=Paenibacillus sediminis TaxID=664909 RepID=A0ABS4H4L4_9BACL|nr:DUF2231 domain-containing protein [Paenibacillus sediminis]MBP1937472.1 putative membrane protein [Paenibacillus sediminis]